jgi:hypothetical protein
MSPEQVKRFQKQADDYLRRASEAVDLQEQRLWFDLARECLRLASDAQKPVVRISDYSGRSRRPLHFSAP